MGFFLINGVAGFIGSAVASALSRKGHRVVGIDSLSSGKKENVPPGVLFIEGDCGDADLYRNLPGEFPYEAIFHVAGFDHKEDAEPLLLLRENTESTLQLLRFALHSGCRRFIHASGMAVYEKSDEAVTEDTRERPENAWGVCKLASEHFLRIHEELGIRSTSLRLFNVYGPGSDKLPARSDLVDDIMGMMIRQGHIHVRGNPNRFLDFVYIDDAVRAFLACLDHEASCGKSINIGGSGKVTVGDLVEKIRALSPVPVTVEFSKDGRDDFSGLHADPADAAKYLGYEGEVSLEEGLARTYARMSEYERQ